MGFTVHQPLTLTLPFLQTWLLAENVYLNFLQLCLLVLLRLQHYEETNKMSTKRKILGDLKAEIQE